MRLSRFTLSLLASGLLAGAASTHALVVSGTDLLGSGFQQAFKNELAAAGLTVALSLDGSLRGEQDLAQGIADAALLAIPDSEKGNYSWRTFPLGFQVVAFAVHASNPVTELSYSQLKNLYEEGGLFNNWSDLTPATDWRDRKISLWIAQGADIISLEIFNAMVLQGASVKGTVRYSSGTPAQLLALVVEDPAALVLVPAIAVNPSVRLLAVKEGDTQQGYTPSPDNVLFGDYPLRLPFHLAVADSLDAGTVAKLLGALYSPAVTAALRAEGYLPVSETEQRSILASFD